MIQKATWIIPGILVTLLLGLLWAMPAFAADAGDIEFLDDGENEISYLSLNGLGSADDPITIQVTDQDLNKPTKYTGDKRLNGNGGNNVVDADKNPIDWTNLADMDGDGKENINDIKFYDKGENDATPEAAGAVLDITNGTLKGVKSDYKVEFYLDEKTSISGRVARTETRTVEIMGLTAGLAVEIEAKNLEITDISPPKPASYAKRKTEWTWLDILDTNRDGKLDDEDTGITPKSASDGTVGVAAIKAVNADGDDAGFVLTLEYAITTAFDDGGTPVDYTDDTLAVVKVTASGRAEVKDSQGDVTADLINVASSVNLTLNVPVPAIGSDENSVSVSSDAFGAGIDVILTETGADSGKFEATLTVCDSSKTDGTCEAEQADSDGSGPTDGKGTVNLPVNAAGDTIRVTYSDASPSRTRTASIPLDVSGPSFSNLAPASGTAGREDEPTVSFTVADTDSGISDDKDEEDSVKVLAGIYAIGGDSFVGVVDQGTVDYERDDLKLEEATNGYSASVTIEEGGSGDELNADGLGDEYEIHWWAVAMDLAGNVGVSDSDSDTACTVPDTADISVSDLEGAEGCDPFVIRVDAAAPELDGTNTVTGTWYDGTDVKDGADAKRTSIVVAFNEALDCSSVDATDFTVGGRTPNDVTCKGLNVYLDVDELGPNDKPEVEVAAESLTDKAGNLIGADEEVTANDGIPAKLSVVVTGSGEGNRPITDKDLTITISSDERLSGNPKVTISKVGTGNILVEDTGRTGTAQPTGNVNEWVFKPSFGDDDDGLYNIRVTGKDLGSGALKLDAAAGTKGVAVEASGDYKHDPDSKSAILFEVDNEVQGPAYKPKVSTDDPNVFIRADFADEGKEYGLGTYDKGTEDKTDDTKDGDATNTPGEVATDFDTSGTVTLVSATFNGDDVTSDVITRDNILFVYRPGNLTDGDHAFTIEVMDNAGNEMEFTHDFAKAPTTPYELELNPGPNLVSFPANPVDDDVNAVFGGAGNEDITRVLTFDNATGLWMAATKGADGMFMGDLTTINGMNGYWVLSGGVLDVSVVLESAGSIERPPPHIAVQKGWNLIGVVDAQQRIAGSGIATSDYFANIDAQVVYGFDSLSGRLARLSIAKAAEGEEQDNVKTGSAYWVYANEAGVIIP